MHVPARCLRVGSTIAAGALVAASVAIAPAHASNVAGMVVFLDPGHQANMDGMGRQVPNGRGGTKDCQAGGTSTDDGFPEHTFSWDTTLKIRQLLSRYGVRTAMSRGDDTGPGPCVDERAQLANSLAPNATVSIHADGGPATGRGFHVLYSSPPLNQVQAGASVKFAQTMRDALVKSGIPAANYIGRSGLDARADIAGLNLAQYPSILVECGNMKNPADSALMRTPEGQQKYAEAVVRGIVAFLQTQPPRAT